MIHHEHHWLRIDLFSDSEIAPAMFLQKSLNFMSHKSKYYQQMNRDESFFLISGVILCACRNADSQSMMNEELLPNY